MKPFRATLNIDWQPELVLATLSKERTDFKRSSIDINNKEGSVEIYVSAEDATAFRASLNSLLQALQICHDIKSI